LPARLKYISRMTQPFICSGAVKIEEGSVLFFKVLNLVKLQDNRDYYILEDPNGVKHFIDAETYANYGIKVGGKLKCKVAKINCTGRILLEPMHPIYIEGQTYFFTIIDLHTSGSEIALILKDIFSNRIEITIPYSNYSSINHDKFIRCKVINLKKGVPDVEVVY
jgi:hypothetical protein